MFEKQIAALADKSRTVGGKPTSLAELGYGTVGIDDCWQDCLSPESLNGSYHTATGKPLVDASRFPQGLRGAISLDFHPILLQFYSSFTPVLLYSPGLTDKATAKGIQLGWYGNNCPETGGVGRGPKYCELQCNFHLVCECFIEMQR